MKHNIKQEKVFSPITLSLTFETKQEADFAIGLLGRLSPENAITYYEAGAHGRNHPMSRDTIRECFESLASNIRRPLLELLGN